MKNFIKTCLKYYKDPLIIKILLYQELGVAIIFTLIFAIINGLSSELPVKYLIGLANLEVVLLVSWIFAVPFGVFTYIKLIEEKDEEQV